MLVAGGRTPHVVTRAMVETMKPGAAVIDVAIDQGGCVETSRPTTIAEPTFVYHGVTHYCVPNLTADTGRSTSVAVAQAILPYMLRIGDLGIDKLSSGYPTSPAALTRIRVSGSGAGRRRRCRLDYADGGAACCCSSSFLRYSAVATVSG